jgi:hypothetical protein
MGDLCLAGPGRKTDELAAVDLEHQNDPPQCVLDRLVDLRRRKLTKRAERSASSRSNSKRTPRPVRASARWGLPVGALVGVDKTDILRGVMCDRLL